MQLRQQFFEAVLYKNINLAIKMISNSPTKAYLDIMGDKYHEEILNELKSIAKSKTLPEHFQFINNHLYIDPIRSVFGYGLANAGWLDKLSYFLKDKKVVEVMAGNGIISGYLQSKGINIISTDDNSWNLSELNRSLEFSGLCIYPYTTIEKISAVDAVNKYGKTVDYLIMSWPPYKSDVAYNVLKTLRTVNPKAKIIYIGEYNGCCANSRFFTSINSISDRRIEKINQYFQRFCSAFGPFSMEMMNDKVYLIN